MSNNQYGVLGLAFELSGNYRMLTREKEKEEGEDMDEVAHGMCLDDIEYAGDALTAKGLASMITKGRVKAIRVVDHGNGHRGLFLETSGLADYWIVQETETPARRRELDAKRDRPAKQVESLDDL